MKNVAMIKESFSWKLMIFVTDMSFNEKKVK